MVNVQSIWLLEERDWIEVIGHGDVLERPVLFVTTAQFLDDWVGITGAVTATANFARVGYCRSVMKC